MNYMFCATLIMLLASNRSYAQTIVEEPSSVRLLVPLDSLSNNHSSFIEQVCALWDKKRINLPKDLRVETQINVAHNLKETQAEYLKFSMIFVGYLLVELNRTNDREINYIQNIREISPFSTYKCEDYILFEIRFLVVADRN